MLENFWTRSEEFLSRSREIHNTMNLQQLWGILTWTRKSLVMAWSPTIDSSSCFGLNWGPSVPVLINKCALTWMAFVWNQNYIFSIPPSLLDCVNCLPLPWSVSCWIHSAARGCMQWMASHSLDDESWVYVSIHIPLVDFCILHIDIYALTIHIYVHHIVARISSPFLRVAV